MIGTKFVQESTHEHASVRVQPELALASLERALALSPGHAEAAAEGAELRVLVLRRRADCAAGGRRLQVGEAGS